MSDETPEPKEEDQDEPKSSAPTDPFRKREGGPTAPIIPPTPAKRISQVIPSEMVKVEKKTIGMRIRKILFRGSFQSAGQFAVEEVLFPSIRSTIADFGHSILDNVFGQERGTYRGSRGSGVREVFEARPRTNYSMRRESPFDRSDMMRDRRMMDDRFARRRNNDFRQVTITSRLEAERILDILNEACERYGYVSVGDYYDSVGLRPENTDYKWGWTTLRRVGIVPTHEGWMIDMPSAEPL